MDWSRRGHRLCLHLVRVDDADGWNTSVGRKKKAMEIPRSQAMAAAREAATLWRLPCLPREGVSDEEDHKRRALNPCWTREVTHHAQLPHDSGNDGSRRRPRLVFRSDDPSNARNQRGAWSNSRSSRRRSGPAAPKAWWEHPCMPLSFLRSWHFDASFCSRGQHFLAWRSSVYK